MAVDRYVSTRSVALLAGQTLVLPHFLVANGAPAVPTTVLPDRATEAACTAVDATNATYHNPTAGPLTAVFVATFIHSINRAPSDMPDAPVLWQGANRAGSSPLYVVPRAADFPIRRLTAGSIADGDHAMLLRGTPVGGFDVQYALQAFAPPAPWIRYHKHIPLPYAKDFIFTGLILRDSVTGHFLLSGFGGWGGGAPAGWHVIYQRFSDPNTRVQDVSNLTTWLDPNSMLLALEDDGVNYNLYASNDPFGNNMLLIYTANKAVDLAAYDQIGFGCNALNNAPPNWDATMAIQHFAPTKPT